MNEKEYNNTTSDYITLKKPEDLYIVDNWNPYKIVYFKPMSYEEVTDNIDFGFY